MTPETLTELARLPQFPRSARELMRVAGQEAAAALITAWPGQEFDVPRRVGGGNPAGERQWDRLVEIVQYEAARRIVMHWGGQPLDIPNCKEVLWARAQDRIRADYDRLTGAEGYSHRTAIFELGIAYGVVGRCIENVIKRPDNAPREEQQLALF